MNQEEKPFPYLIYVWRAFNNSDGVMVATYKHSHHGVIHVEVKYEEGDF